MAEDNERKGVSIQEAVELLCNSCDLWLAEDKEIFVSFEAGPKDDRHWEHWYLHSREAEGWIRINLHAATKKMPRKNDIEECKAQLEAVALNLRNEHPVCLRVAMHGGNLYVDLGTSDWQVAEITDKGWDVIKNPPVKFRRVSNMMPLPTPERGGSIELLRSEINTKGRRDFLLAVSWLIGAFNPFGPYAILLFTGQAGSAKSCAARTILKYVNASQAPTQGAPKDEQGLMVMAEHNVAVCFDNSGTMKGFLPNALCRLATGSGLSMRKLYKNKEMVFFGGARPIMLTAISPPCRQSDFIDRTIQIKLQQIPTGVGKRKTERQMRTGSKQSEGKILGAIFDILSTLLSNLDKIDPDSLDLPRMADFAYWVVCAEEAIGWKKGEFLQYFAINRAESFNHALDGDVLAVGIEKIMVGQEKWEGNATELRASLVKELDSSAGVPENPSILSNELNSLAVALNMKGIGVETGIRLPGGQKRLIRLWRMGDCDAVTPETPILLPNQENEKNIRSNGENAVTPSHPVDEGGEDE